MFKSGDISKGIKNFKISIGSKQPDARSKISNAIARLGLSPDEKLRIINQIAVAENKYETAVKLLGQLTADKIKYCLD